MLRSAGPGRHRSRWRSACAGRCCRSRPCPSGADCLSPPRPRRRAAERASSSVPWRSAWAFGHGRRTAGPAAAHAGARWCWSIVGFWSPVGRAAPRPDRPGRSSARSPTTSRWSARSPSCCSLWRTGRWRSPTAALARLVGTLARCRLRSSARRRVRDGAFGRGRDWVAAAADGRAGLGSSSPVSSRFGRVRCCPWRSVHIGLIPIYYAFACATRRPTAPHECSTRVRAVGDRTRMTQQFACVPPTPAPSSARFAALAACRGRACSIPPPQPLAVRDRDGRPAFSPLLLFLIAIAGITTAVVAAGVTARDSTAWSSCCSACSASRLSAAP